MVAPDPDALTRKPPKRTKPIIGIVGGVGAGKSSVARLLSAMGAGVVDSDQDVRELLADSEIISTLGSWFEGVVRENGGGIDRRALARIVFSSPDQRERLEGLLYPKLAELRAEATRSFEADPAIKAIVYDAPKLLEAGLQDECDAVIFVDSERKHRLKRVARERHWQEQELQRRENSQYPLDRKRAFADYLVVNNSTFSDLRRRVAEVFSEILAAFSR